MKEEVVQLRNRGKYSEAILLLEEILESKEISQEQRLQSMHLLSYCCSRSGNLELEGDEYLDKGIKIAEEAVKQSIVLENPVSKFDSLYWSFFSYYMKGIWEKTYEIIEQAELAYIELKELQSSQEKEKLCLLKIMQAIKREVRVEFDENYKRDNEEIIQLLNEAMELCKELKDEYTQGVLYDHLGVYYRGINLLQEAVEAVDKAIEIFEKLCNYPFLHFCIRLKGWVFFYQGDYDIFLNYQKESLEVAEKLDSKPLITRSYHDISTYYTAIGEWKTALDYRIKAHEIITEIGREDQFWFLLFRIANVLAALGETEEALEYYEKAEDLMKRRGEDSLSIRVGFYLNISTTLIQHGELDEALTKLEEVLNYSKRTGFNYFEAQSLRGLSLVYRRKGIFEKSHEYMKNALELNKEVDHKINIIEILYDLFLLSVEFKKEILAQEYYEELKSVSETIEHKNIKKLALIAEAILLKNSSETRDRVRSEVLFDQLLLENLGIAIQIEILFHLSELLLEEFRITSDSKIFEKLQKSTDRLIESGAKANFTQLRIDGLFFKSQLEMINLEFDRAGESLSKALEIAEVKGFKKLALKIIKAKEKMITDSIKLEEIKDSSNTFSERMEITKLENGFKEIKNQSSYKFEVEKIEKYESTSKLFSIKI
jgi:tetratricopeptide (TPR) repeat protein